MGAEPGWRFPRWCILADGDDRTRDLADNSILLREECQLSSFLVYHFAECPDAVIADPWIRLSVDDMERGTTTDTELPSSAGVRRVGAKACFRGWAPLVKPVREQPPLAMHEKVWRWARRLDHGLHGQPFWLHRQEINAVVLLLRAWSNWPEACHSAYEGV